MATGLLIASLLAVVTASPWQHPPDPIPSAQSQLVQRNVLALLKAWDSPSDCPTVASYYTSNTYVCSANTNVVLSPAHA
jgi:hypothetical protein